MWKEFKQFITRGNVIDLAIGVVVGAAFGKIVTSFVNDILMPPIGLLLGQVNFANMFIPLSGGTYATLEEAQAAGAVTINYGIFINTIIDFLIITFVIFVLIKQVNRLKRPKPAATPDTKACPYCLSTIPAKASRCPHCTSELEIT
jgi:large conductance mechanosensitive channel